MENDMSASEMDSRVASTWPSTISSDVLQRLPPVYPIPRITFGYGMSAAERVAASHRRSMIMTIEFLQLLELRYPASGGRFGAVRASESEIASLPKATADEVRHKDCAVCLESFEEGGETLTIRKMTCPSSHPFHEGCIFKWLRVSRLCPLCRFALPAEQEEQDDADTESDDEIDETDIEGDA